MTPRKSPAWPAAMRAAGRALAFHLPALAVLATGLVLALAATTEWQRAERMEAAATFHQKAQESMLDLAGAIDQTLADLDGVTALLATVPDVNRSQFSRFAARLVAHNPSIQAFEWVPRIPFGERAAAEDAVRADGLAGFQIRERDAAGTLRAAGDRPDYFPVMFAEPLKGNEAAIGYDLASNPERRAALVQARDSGAPVATARITLVQETAGQFGFLVVAPLWQDGVDPGTSEARRAALRGYTLGVFRLPALVRNAGITPERPIEIAIADATPGAGNALMFSSQPGLGAISEITAEITATRSIPVAGRVWDIVAYPRGGRMAVTTAWVGQLIFTGTATIAAVLALYVAALRIGRRRSEALTAALADSLDSLHETQDQLVRNEKMATLGTLAGGVAHEINTPAQFINDNLAFLGQSLDDLAPVFDAARIAAAGGSIDPALQQRLARADLEFLTEESRSAVAQSKDGIARIAQIAAGIRLFAHPGKAAMEPTTPHELMDSVATISKSVWRYAAELEVVAPADLPAVACQPTEISQVLLNLVINAVHAIEARRDPALGRITIAARRIGDWVELSVADTGIGIPEEHRNRVWDLFFTTKDVGKGTGQGLAIAHRIVCEHHGGRIDFESTPGQGTRFFFTLPIADPADAAPLRQAC